MYIFWLNIREYVKDGFTWLLKIMLIIVCYLLMAILSVAQRILLFIVGITSLFASFVGGIGLTATTFVGFIMLFKGELGHNWKVIVMFYILFGIITFIPQFAMIVPVVIGKLKDFIYIHLLP